MTSYDVRHPLTAATAVTASAGHQTRTYDAYVCFARRWPMVSRSLRDPMLYFRFRRDLACSALWLFLYKNAGKLLPLRHSSAFGDTSASTQSNAIHLRNRDRAWRILERNGRDNSGSPTGGFMAGGRVHSLLWNRGYYHRISLSTIGPKQGKIALFMSNVGYPPPLLVTKPGRCRHHRRTRLCHSRFSQPSMVSPSSQAKITMILQNWWAARPLSLVVN